MDLGVCLARSCGNYMFGQFAWFGVPFVPGAAGVVVEGDEDAAGAGLADGSGLAALTTAAPPTVRRPTARRSEAATRLMPDGLAAGVEVDMVGASPASSVGGMANSWSCMVGVPFRGAG
jgi:hypothetical protein